MTEAGHNTIAADRLRSLVDRIERLEEEKRGIASDIKDIYAEAKSAGFDPKVLRALIAERRKDAAEVEEHQSLLDLYRDALGAVGDDAFGAGGYGAGRMMDRTKFANGVGRLFLEHTTEAAQGLCASAASLRDAKTRENFNAIISALGPNSASSTAACALYEVACLAAVREENIPSGREEMWTTQIVDYLASVGVPRDVLLALVKEVTP